MPPGAAALPLSALEVLVVDCQATGAAPRGHLLEIGWARLGPTATGTEARLVAMPDGARVPPAVARITGITDRMLRGAIDQQAAWRSLAVAAATITPQPAPTVIHFARFEQPFLDHLAGGAPPLDVVCTHAIAARLLPELPRRSLRALAGYFGRSVGPLRRSADHVEATAFVWRELVGLLDAEGVSTWSALKAWLAVPAPTKKRTRRVWPMPRDVRLALPDAPGVYRMLRTSGDVLYVGKAASLRDRVNSYFRHKHGVPERMLEMLSQARRISFDVSPTALEAALLEADEIKSLQPPYNIALTETDRRVWFATPDLLVRSGRPSSGCRVGPFPSVAMLDAFAALARESRDALGRGRWAPDTASFDEGYARFRQAHHELSRNRVAVTARLLRIGRRLWREGRRDRDVDASLAGDHRVSSWTPEYVQRSLEWLVIRTALARRRAAWFTRLAEASLAWCEPGAAECRLLVVENGDIIEARSGRPEMVAPRHCSGRPRACRGVEGQTCPPEPPIPPGHRRPIAARHEAFTLARFDRLRVLTTELKRLVAGGAPVAVRLGASPALARARLASLLAWL